MPHFRNGDLQVLLYCAVRTLFCCCRDSILFCICISLLTGEGGIIGGEQEPEIFKLYLANLKKNCGTPELCRTDLFSVQHTFLAFLRDPKREIFARGKRIIGGSPNKTPRHLLIVYGIYKNNKLYIHKYCFKKQISETN